MKGENKFKAVIMGIVVVLLLTLLTGCNLPKESVKFWVDNLGLQEANEIIVDDDFDKSEPYDYDSEPFPLEPGDSVDDPAPALTLAEELPGEVTLVDTMTVRLIPLDVRLLDNPPEVIAYANVEHSAPPENVLITSQGDLWTYNANIALMNKGDWISATCTLQNITAVGVRLEGDANDGWLRVLVDGTEMWRGNIYGPTENMFLNYLEISGLVPGEHTIRVENLGITGDGGGDDVAMRFFGCSSTSVSGYTP